MGSGTKRKIREWTRRETSVVGLEDLRASDMAALSAVGKFRVQDQKEGGWFSGADCGLRSDWPTGLGTDTLKGMGMEPEEEREEAQGGL